MDFFAMYSLFKSLTILADAFYAPLSKAKEIGEWKAIISQEQLRAMILVMESLGRCTDGNSN